MCTCIVFDAATITGVCTVGLKKKKKKIIFYSKWTKIANRWCNLKTPYLLIPNFESMKNKACLWCFNKIRFWSLPFHNKQTPLYCTCNTLKVHLKNVLQFILGEGVRDVEREDPGTTPRVAVDFYLQGQLVFRLFDSVPLTPMSSHCWHVKEPYHSARVQVMGSGKPTQSQERKQYMCTIWFAHLWVLPR